jgi:hypothetical protein
LVVAMLNAAVPRTLIHMSRGVSFQLQGYACEAPSKAQGKFCLAGTFICGFSAPFVTHPPLPSATVAICDSHLQLRSEDTTQGYRATHAASLSLISCGASCTAYCWLRC